jgi:hypothetical protein
MAKVLFVRTGEISLMPEMHGDGLKLGSVQIARTDPFRRFLIGVAPLLVGGALLVLLTSYYLRLTSGDFAFNTYYVILTSLFIYSLFVLSNTMFSSKKDMEGALGLLVFVVVVLSIIFIAGRGELVVIAGKEILSNPSVIRYSNSIAILLLFPLAVNIGIIILFKLVKKR